MFNIYQSIQIQLMHISSLSAAAEIRRSKHPTSAAIPLFVAEILIDERDHPPVSYRWRVSLNLV